MKIIIDASNIKVGGGIQVAVSTVKSLLRNSRGNLIYFVISSFVYCQLSDDERHQAEFLVLDCNIDNPLRFLKGYNLRLDFERKIRPDLYFTLFGPAFYFPVSKYHLIGFANAWIVSPETIAYEVLPLFVRAKMKFKNIVLGHFLYRKDYFYVVETKSIASKFCNYFKADESRVFVVGNTLSLYFTSAEGSSIPNICRMLSELKKFKFVSITHNYPHKNLSVISDVGAILESRGLDCTFVVTFPEKEYETMPYEFRKYTTNIGPVEVKDCPAVYDCCDALFLPTLIECFSVSYLEAMYKNLPIATSHFDFARDVCGDYAVYFNPLDPISVAESLIRIVSGEANSSLNIEEQKKNVIMKFGTLDDKVDKYLDIMNIIRGKENNV